MTSEQLRNLQSPLKKKYKDNPVAALVTLRSEGNAGRDVTFDVHTRHGNILAGLHPATGGTGKEVCSGDMLLDALVACAGVTLKAVATAMEIPLRDVKISAEGDIDFRGTLGVSKEVPVGFRDIRLHFSFDTDAPQQQIETLLKLTERYCVVFQTLSKPAGLTISHSAGSKA